MRGQPKWLFVLIPLAAFAIGMGQTMAAAAGIRPLEAITLASLVIAGVAPILSTFALSRFGQRPDFILIGAAGMLTSIGASALFALSANLGAEADFYRSVSDRHALFVGAGFVALTAGALVAPRIELVRRYPFTLVAMAIGLVVSTAAFGETVNGARLWLQFGPARFQPSEIARLLLIGFIAVFLYERRHLVTAPWQVGPIDLPPAPYLLPLVGALLGGVAVLAVQNDLGMAALIALGAFTVVSGVLNSRSAVFLATTVMMLAAIASYALVPRVRDRVSGWLNPSDDPTGKGFQFLQADFGATAGGILGAGGPGAALAVPEVHTDFILIGVSSQFGLLAALAVLALSAVIVIRCVMIATRARNTFAGLLALSIASLYAIQLLLIAGGTLRVLPLTGLTFPLVSYGGTSLIVTLFSLGLIVGIGANATPGR